MTLDIQSSDQLFRRVVETLDSGVLVVESNGRIVYANESAEDILEQESETLADQTVGDIISVNKGPLAQSDEQNFAAATSDVEQELVDINDDPYLISASQLTHGNEQLRLLSITELSTQSAKDTDLVFYKNAFQSANEAMLVFDPAVNQFIDCNQHACDLLGYSRDELLTLGPTDLHPHEINDFESFINEVRENGTAWTDTLTCYSCKKEKIPVEISASRLDAEGRECIVATIRDISEQKDYETRLEALTETTRQLMAAENATEVADITLEIIHEVLDYHVTAVWEFDETDEVLRLLGASEQVRKQLLDETETGTPVITDGTAEMRCFRDGEAQFLREYGDVADAAHPELALESRFIVPLGRHGLLSVGVPEDNAIDATLQDLFRIVAGNAESAMDRLHSEKKIRRRSVAMAAANDAIAILSENAEFVYVNQAYADLFGYESQEAVLDVSWRSLLNDNAVERMETDVIPTVTDEGNWRGELTGRRVDGTVVQLGVTMTKLEDGGFVNVCRDISKQKQQERRLKTLNEMNRALMQAEARDDIAERGIATIKDCLPFDIVAIRLFDPETNTLNLNTLTDEAKSLLDSRPAYDLESTYAGTAYRRGEPVTHTPSNELATDEYPEYASLHVSLRKFGTLTILSTTNTEFDEDIVEFVRLLGTALGIAFERVEREQELRDRRDELTRLNRINNVVREIIQSLVEAATREEIEEIICQRLTESDLYEHAWIGTVGADGAEITPRASAGINDDLLQTTGGLDLFESGMGSIMKAVETGTIQTVRQYQIPETRLETDETRVDDLRTFEVVAAIPLTYSSRVYGVLIVNTTEMESFDESARAEFELLGETAGFAIDAVRNRQLLLSNRVVELKFEVKDSQSLVVAVSDALDCQCRLEIAKPIEGEGVRCYLRVHGEDGDAAANRIQQIDSIEHVEVISNNADECLLEIVQRESISEELVHMGANIRTAIGDSGKGEVILEAPQSADIRDIVTRYQSRYPDSELVAKRERERGGKSIGEFRETIEKELTERQQMVLETAYETGYFDWPRESTAEDVAEEIGISSPTLHQHLRTAERKLLAALLREDSE